MACAAGRILVVGASSPGPCGVRDHARILGRALQDRGIAVQTVWWEREAVLSARRTMACARALNAEVRRVLEEDSPDCILIHYSVFTWAWHGVPVCVPELARQARQWSAPVILVFHEIAFPLSAGGWRGTLWAVTQRAVLPAILGASRGAVVTVEERARWLSRKRLLPRRPVIAIPVFSNVPQPSLSDGSLSSEFRIGIFGYTMPEFSRQGLLTAFRSLESRGMKVELTLVGAPGADSAEGQGWMEAARLVGCEDMVGFTGILDPSELAAALASIDVMAFIDPCGPTSRKGTLAASLALGRAVVALDGPQTWKRLAQERAVVLAADSQEMADKIHGLWEDVEMRRQQGRRAMAFYDQWMSAEKAALDLLGFLEEIRTPVCDRGG